MKQIKQINDVLTSTMDDVAKLVIINAIVAKKKTPKVEGEKVLTIHVFDQGENIACHVKEHIICKPSHVKAAFYSLTKFAEKKIGGDVNDLSDLIAKVAQGVMKKAAAK